jgi:acetyltransferase-like isoleucine patch superfamily enzyme
MNWLNVLPKLFILLKKCQQMIPKVKRKIYLRQLNKKDIMAWTLEMWRSRGLRMGQNCIIFPSADILSEPYLVEIGDNVIITGSVKLLTHDGSTMLFRKENETNAVYGRIIIGNNVFVGLGSIILPNVTIGDNVIVGAGSVVRGNIPDNSIVMGNPAKIIFKFQMGKKMLLNNKNFLQFSKGLSEYDLVTTIYEHFKYRKEP